MNSIDFSRTSQILQVERARDRIASGEADYREEMLVGYIDRIEAENARLHKQLDRLTVSGRKLANIAFNLSQRDHLAPDYGPAIEALEDHIHQLMLVRRDQSNWPWRFADAHRHTIRSLIAVVRWMRMEEALRG